MAMNYILKQIGNLHAEELYSNIVQIGELAMTICDQKQDLITPLMKFQLFVYVADAYFHLQQYISAENTYTQALQIRKFILKAKSNSNKLIDTPKELVNDIDIKYKVYMCCIKLKQNQRAIEVLQSISARARTPKVNMALGTLYRDAGMERSAVTCYKEVLRECPFSLEAAENLLKLGVKGIEVNSMILESTADCSWINTWLRGQAQMHSRDYSSALVTFNSLDTYGLLKDNRALVVNSAFCHYFMCDDKKALSCFLRALRLDPQMRIGRDLLASLLAVSAEKEHYKELERLLSPELDMALWSSEHWVVMGYYMYASKKYDRAAYFGQQACTMNRRNVEALLLKAATFMQINKYVEASLHCREALQYSPYRFDGHKALVECYVYMNRLREALTVASSACKLLNNNPQSLTLCASIMMKDPVTSCKARPLLERSLVSDPAYTPAVYLLVELLDQEQLYDEACSLLSRHAEVRPSSKLHQLLADYYIRLQKEEEAFDHYNVALRLDPNNQRALEGMNNMGRPGKVDSAYYVSVGGESSSSRAPSASDHEPDPESDTDQWPNNSLMSFE